MARLGAAEERREELAKEVRPRAKELTSPADKAATSMSAQGQGIALSDKAAHAQREAQHAAALQAERTQLALAAAATRREEAIAARVRLQARLASTHTLALALTLTLSPTLTLALTLTPTLARTFTRTLTRRGSRPPRRARRPRRIAPRRWTPCCGGAPSSLASTPSTTGAASSCGGACASRASPRCARPRRQGPPNPNPIGVHAQAPPATLGPLATGGRSGGACHWQFETRTRDRSVCQPGNKSPEYPPSTHRYSPVLPSTPLVY